MSSADSKEHHSDSSSKTNENDEPASSTKIADAKDSGEQVAGETTKIPESSTEKPAEAKSDLEADLASLGFIAVAEGKQSDAPRQPTRPSPHEEADSSDKFAQLRIPPPEGTSLMADGFLNAVGPEIENLNSMLTELQQSQKHFLAIIKQEGANFVAGPQSKIAPIARTLNQVPEYQRKLVRMRGQMSVLSRRIARVKTQSLDLECRVQHERVGPKPKKKSEVQSIQAYKPIIEPSRPQTTSWFGRGNAESPKHLKTPSKIPDTPLHLQAQTQTPDQSPSRNNYPPSSGTIEPKAESSPFEVRTDLKIEPESVMAKHRSSKSKKDKHKKDRKKKSGKDTSSSERDKDKERKKKRKKKKATEISLAPKTEHVAANYSQS